MFSYAHGYECTHLLPTIRLVEGMHFIPMHNLTLKSFMDFPIQSWQDFDAISWQQLCNLRWLLPLFVYVPVQIPIVSEFSHTWSEEQHTLVWNDCWTLLRVEEVSSYGGIIDMVNIDPIPWPSFTRLRMFTVSQSITAHNFYSCIDDICRHILQRGQRGVEVDIISTPIPEGNRIKYTLQTILT